MNVSKILILAYLVSQLLIVALLFRAKSVVDQNKLNASLKGLND